MKKTTAEHEMVFDQWDASCDLKASYRRHLFVRLRSDEYRTASDENHEAGGLIMGVLGVVVERTNTLVYYGYGIALNTTGKPSKNRMAKSIRMHPSRVPERVRKEIRHAVATPAGQR
jgi:hypothetical protein